jgi:L-ribulose-5-phosphate 4-epimerase
VFHVHCYNAGNFVAVTRLWPEDKSNSPESPPTRLSSPQAGKGGKIFRPQMQKRIFILRLELPVDIWNNQFYDGGNIFQPSIIRPAIQLGKFYSEKLGVLEATRWLAEHGYLGKRSSGGNVSLRVEHQDAIAITPSGKAYLKMAVEDVCVVDLDGDSLDGNLKPSIEVGMHLGIYKHRPDVKAVIHTHQAYASVLSILNRPIPALFDEIIVEIGKVVEVIPYAFSGSGQLVQNVADKLDNRCHCYLIQNHGALSLGADMDRALKNAELLENVARIYYYGLATGLDISKLPADAIEHFAEMRKLRFHS